MAHGLAAMAALTLLVYAHVTVGFSPMETTGTALLTLAGAVDITLNLRFHNRGLPLPTPWVIGHAALAVAGFALLLVGALA